MTRPERWVAVLAAVVAAALLAGCGIPLDSHPHEISDQAVQELVTPSTSSPTTSPAAGAPEVTVYFLRDDTLQALRIPVKADPSLPIALRFVLAGPTSAQLATGLSSSVPPGTKLHSATVQSDGTARIDLSDEINTVGGRSGKAAYAEMVFTALAFPGVDRVQFTVDGSPITAPTDDGSVATVTDDNYKPPLSPS